MKKARLRYSSRGWSKFLFSYVTGSKDIRTGAIIPYMRDGVAWPPVMECWSVPEPTAAQAFAFNG